MYMSLRGHRYFDHICWEYLLLRVSKFADSSSSWRRAQYTNHKASTQKKRWYSKRVISKVVGEIIEVEMSSESSTTFHFPNDLVYFISFFRVCWSSFLKALRKSDTCSCILNWYGKSWCPDCTLFIPPYHAILNPFVWNKIYIQVNTPSWI
jgi:hypothetical protein